MIEFHMHKYPQFKQEIKGNKEFIWIQFNCMPFMLLKINDLPDKDKR